MIVLDTHIWIWLCTDDPRASARVRDAIIAEERRPLLSVASLWEVSLLVQRGRLEVDDGVDGLLRAYAVRILPLTQSVVLSA